MLNRYETATNALRAFEKTGTKLPTAVRAALDNAATIHRFIAETNSNNLPGAILEALRAGTDPANDPDVAAATQRAVWAQPAKLSTLQQTAETETTRAVAANADAMITAMTPAFNAAVEELKAAHGILGDLDLRADHTRILALGSAAATAWATAISAVERTDAILSAWGAIAQTAGVSDALFATRMVEWNPDTWAGTRHDVRHLQVGADAWAALRHGWTLRLADFATLRKFETAVAEAEEQAREATEKKRNRSPIFNTH